MIALSEAVDFEFSVGSKWIDMGLILKAQREQTTLMFSVFFSILVVVALLSIFGEIVMRIRLTRRETSRDKLAWWRRGGDEVSATYEELFPHGRIPLFRRFAFWLFVVWSCVLLLSILVRRSN
jgi:hypothetical protein